jgi:D-ribose pyranose/furanose isomerase RbsD
MEGNHLIQRGNTLFSNIFVEDEYFVNEREEDSYFAPIHVQKKKPKQMSAENILRCRSFEPLKQEEKDRALRVARGLFYCPMENEQIFKGFSNEQ